MPEPLQKNVIQKLLPTYCLPHLHISREEQTFAIHKIYRTILHFMNIYRAFMYIIQCVVIPPFLILKQHYLIIIKFSPKMCFSSPTNFCFESFSSSSDSVQILMIF